MSQMWPYSVVFSILALIFFANLLSFINQSTSLTSSKGFISTLSESRKGLESALYDSYKGTILKDALALVESNVLDCSNKLLPQVRPPFGQKRQTETG